MSDNRREALEALRDKVKAGGDIPASLVQQLLVYEDQTGFLYWRVREDDFFKDPSHAFAWNRRYAGKRAFTSKVKGYHQGSIFNRHIYAHRAAFCCVFGRWPENIDHINGDKADNRLCNIREVTHVQNMRNIPITSANKSGVFGVNWIEKKSAWRASIGVSGKTVFIGEYHSKSEAIIARAAAEKVLDFHENHGRSALISETPKGETP